MSSIVVSGDTSGAITIAAPAVAGTNTLTLPANTGTLISNRTAGGILQVVQGTYSSTVTTTSTSFVTTNLTASITPNSSTNKILVRATIADPYVSASGTNMCFTIYRNSTNISPAGTGLLTGFAILWGGSSAVQSNQTFEFLDSPNTTSSTTYTIYFGSYQGNSVSINQNGTVSTITLMEVAA